MGRLTVAPGTATVIQGLPEFGKTTLVRQLLAAHADAGATCIVQDPDHQFADLFPVYETADDYRRAAAAAGAEPFPRGAAIAELEAKPVTALATAIAPTVRAAGGYTVLAYDEAVLAADPSHIDKPQANLLARRRRWGVSMILNVQDFGQCHAIWQRLSTEIFLFQCDDRDRVKQIAQRWGRKPDKLWLTVSQLRPFQWARLSRKRPDADADAA